MVSQKSRAMPARKKRFDRLTIGISVFCLVLAVSVLVFSTISTYTSSPDSPTARTLNDKGVASGDEWLLIFYILGILYMFLALAIVVDEFFVPALMFISESLELSDDVAGATLMAAGGSAPELFTSFIGTFRESDVGFGTIVGSATFNVLFVIGMCAIFSSEPLALTWWPLFRDCVCYIISLITLFIFFGPVSPSEIEWWESIILFSLYLGYCGLMKVHHQVHHFIMRKISGPDWKPDEIDEEAQYMLHNRATFRAGIAQLLTGDADMEKTAGIVAVYHLKGNLEDTFNQIDTDQNGVIDQRELQVLLDRVLKRTANEDEMRMMLADMKGRSSSATSGRTIANGDETELLEPIDDQTTISKAEFSRWYIHSEQRIMRDMYDTWEMMDTNGDNQLDHAELVKCVRRLNALGTGSGMSRRRSVEMVDTLLENVDRDKDGKISLAEFERWFRQSLLFQHAEDAQDSEDAAAEPLSLAWPSDSGPRGKALYLLTLPIVFLLSYTLPNTQREGQLFGRDYAKWAPVTFVLSIMWIGVFSFAMVDWAERVGDTLGIPRVVMGLTFLAAGTSVPDLLSSVVVAKQGKGDMAVSSSIGSNIFDVTIGLPIPWLAYALIYGKPVTVTADSLEFSIVVLICMLVCVVVIIMLNRWVMSKLLGWSMFFLYFLFVLQDLIFNFYCDTDKNGSYFDGCR